LKQKVTLWSVKEREKTEVAKGELIASRTNVETVVMFTFSSPSVITNFITDIPDKV